MQIYWTGVLFIAGLVLAEHHHHHHSHDLQEYEEEGQVSEIECDSQGSELREVVTSLKDLKKCLCKLITVQKKQLELDMARKEKDYLPVLENGHNVMVLQSPQAIYSDEKANATETTTKGVLGPDGATMDIKLTTPSPNNSLSATEASTATTSSSETRNKRSNIKSKSDFSEVGHDEFAKMMSGGFAFDDDEESMRQFLAETAHAGPGEHSITVGAPLKINSDRKARDTEGDVEKDTETEPEMDVKSAEESAVAETEEPSIERPSSAEDLTANYDHMEKKKSMPAVSLPRKKSMEFPNGATYYGTGQQKPVDYTLNIPQTTYYLVPGPVPGQNKLVMAPQGTYAPEDDQNPTTSLGAQFAPGITNEDWPADEQHGPVMNVGGNSGLQMMPQWYEGEEEQTEPPKPMKKRRKNRKQKKTQLEETTTTTTTTEASVSASVESDEEES